MRITGGEFRGRQLDVPSDIRPTQDMVREALFSSLASIVPGSRFLDLCAGSGAVGLDAWSRGAAEVCMVESSTRSIASIRKNLDVLRRSAPVGDDCPCRIERCEAVKFIESGASGGQWDIIFADPPYDRHGGSGLLTKILQVLAPGHTLASNGFLVFEQSNEEQCPVLPPWLVMTREKRYGGTMLRFFRPS